MAFEYTILFFSNDFFVLPTVEPYSVYGYNIAVLGSAEIPKKSAF